MSVDDQEKVQYFFQPNQHSIIHQVKSLELDTLIVGLPMYLKAEVCFLLYKQAIDTCRLLQGKH